MSSSLCALVAILGCLFISVDACLEDNGGCDSNANCASVEGSVECTCKDGFLGTGRVCHVDACLEDNGGCDSNATCASVEGSAQCTCKSGFLGTGRVCHVDVCLEENGGCDSNAKCVSILGIAKCTCNPAYFGNGKVCQACSDTRSDCPKYHGKGKCTSSAAWVTWMWKKCPKICGFCLDSTEDGGYSCEDTRADCEKYKRKGKCVSSASWKKWMADKCPKSCGCPYCKDFYDQCPRVAKFCSSGTAGEVRWMNKNCRKTCGCQIVEGCGERGVAAKAAEGVMSILDSLLGGDDERIVGGDDAEAGDYPWQAGIWYTAKAGEQTAKPFCGATLLTPNVVVTAAHCFPDNQDPESHQVRLGDLKVGEDDEGELNATIKSIIKHPNYNAEFYLNDIALVILSEPVRTFTKTLKPICIPETNVLPSSCWISGWGATAEEGATAAHLQHVTVPIVANTVCDATYKALFEDANQQITEDMRCAGYEAGKKDACQGDSGGPLSCEYDGKFHISGVVSWGQGCARARSYGVYTNIYNYLHWIRTTLNWQF